MEERFLHEISFRIYVTPLGFSIKMMNQNTRNKKYFLRIREFHTHGNFFFHSPGGGEQCGRAGRGVRLKDNARWLLAFAGRQTPKDAL